MHLSKKQILITGVYRSGTEYFNILLNEHPEISSTMYRVNLFRFIFEKYGKNKIKYKNLIVDLAKRLKEKHNFKLNKKKYLKIIQGKSYGEIYDCLMSSLYLNKKKRIWAEKNQLQWTKTDLFLNLLPNAYVIHILRDPRNVLASFKYKTYSKYPACLTSIFNSLDAMNNIKQNNKKFKKKFIYLKYEDLIQNPQKSMNTIFKFLNVKKNKINFRKKKYNYLGRKWVVNSSFQNKIKYNTEFNIQDSLNSYKKYLNKNELYLTELICGDMMRKFGYSLNKANNDISKKEINKIINSNKLLEYGYKNWKKKKIGFEMFPTNPLKKKFWDKIQK